MYILHDVRCIRPKSAVGKRLVRRKKKFRNISKLFALDAKFPLFIYNNNNINISVGFSTVIGCPWGNNIPYRLTHCACVPAYAYHNILYNIIIIARIYKHIVQTPLRQCYYTRILYVYVYGLCYFIFFFLTHIEGVL